MTILEGVNELLTALGLKPVTSYASGLGLEASTFLERWSTKIQGRGWHCNTETDVELAPPDTTIAYSVAPTGTFLAGETVTEATSGATGRFCYLEGSKVYMTELTGTFTGGRVLTGGTSAATVTGTTAASVTSGYLYLDSAILNADNQSSSPDVTIRGGRFYNIDDNTFTFDAALTIEQIRKLAFADLPDSLGELIACHAALDFCAKVTKGPAPIDITKRIKDAEIRAAQDDGDRSDTNLQNSAYMRSIMGRSDASIEQR